jgi:hypothetical protein
MGQKQGATRTRMSVARELKKSLGDVHVLNVAFPYAIPKKKAFDSEPLQQIKCMAFIPL